MARTKRVAKRSGVLNRRPQLGDSMVAIKNAGQSNAAIKVVRMRTKYAARRSGHHARLHQHATPEPAVLVTNTKDVTIKSAIHSNDVYDSEVSMATRHSLFINSGFARHTEPLQFRMKIKTVFSTIFPHIKHVDQVRIEKIGQGTYNKVYGVTVPPVGGAVSKLSATDQFGTEYVIRMPYDRKESGQELADTMTREVANLKLVNAKLKVPTPKVVEYKVDSNNALGQPFMIQKRLRGRSLQQLWHLLNGDQRASAVGQITKIIEEIASVNMKGAGYLSPCNAGLPEESICLNTFPVPFWGPPPVLVTAMPKSQRSYIETTWKWMTQQCLRWKWLEVLAQNEAGDGDCVWERLLSIVRSLDQTGDLGEPSDVFSLVHDDLYARDVMGEIKDSKTVEITGVVDWDSAFFAPYFMASRAPLWAWRPEDESAIRETEHLAPKTEDDRKAYNAFIKTASSQYRRSAFSDEAILLRDMFEVIVYGISYPKRRQMAEEIIQRWKKLKK
jgi:aminoglycoside phosphotransferase (APT) family kinase protein